MNGEPIAVSDRVALLVAAVLALVLTCLAGGIVFT